MKRNWEKMRFDVAREVGKGSTTGKKKFELVSFVLNSLSLWFTSFT